MRIMQLALSMSCRMSHALRSHIFVQTETKSHEPLFIALDFDTCGFLLMTNVLTMVGLGTILAVLYCIYWISCSRLVFGAHHIKAYLKLLIVKLSENLSFKSHCGKKNRWIKFLATKTKKKNITEKLLWHLKVWHIAFSHACHIPIETLPLLLLYRA